MKNRRKVLTFLGISALGIYTSNPLASNNTRTKVFFNIILDNAKAPKIYNFSGDFCTYQAQVIFWLSITLGQRFFFQFTIGQCKIAKIGTFFRGFLCLASTSNFLAFDNPRAKDFFNLILDNAKSPKLKLFSGNFCGRQAQVTFGFR